MHLNFVPKAFIWKLSWLMRNWNWMDRVHFIGIERISLLCSFHISHFGIWYFWAHIVPHNIQAISSACEAFPQSRSQNWYVTLHLDVCLSHCHKYTHKHIELDWQYIHISSALASYLIFVIFFTQAKFLESKIHTEKRVN